MTQQDLVQHVLGREVDPLSYRRATYEKWETGKGRKFGECVADSSPIALALIAAANACAERSAHGHP